MMLSSQFSTFWDVAAVSLCIIEQLDPVEVRFRGIVANFVDNNTCATGEGIRISAPSHGYQTTDMIQMNVHRVLPTKRTLS